MHLLLVFIVTPFTLQTFTRAKEHVTLRSRPLHVPSFKIQPQSNDFSYFLTTKEI